MKKSNPTAPTHYQQGGLQVIEILQAKLTPEQFKGFLQGNVLKYTFRYEQKNGVEDLEKAIVYLAWLKEFNEVGKITCNC